VRSVEYGVSTPLSVRHPWYRVTLLGLFVALLALPWTTSYGCSGDEPGVTETGIELFASSAADEPLMMLAPLALIVAALLGALAQRVQRAGRRAWLSLAMLALVTVGSFYSWAMTVLPNASEKVDHHFASWAGTIALVALILDALVRQVLGVREWWLTRRDRRRAR
jgi:cytochrome bd-type quinol oxidase subunit 2